MYPENTLQAAAEGARSIVPFTAAANKLFPFNFTSSNKDLTPGILADTDLFSLYITQHLKAHNCIYGIGGYNEHRTVYARSSHFDTMDEPRRLHLGTDIWGSAGTPVFAPINGIIHSFQFNDHFGDYGATIILIHHFKEIVFHTLYGHLDLLCIQNLREGDIIKKGDRLASFGIPSENGNWPPHLHFQVIYDLEGMRGDYPGVCKYSERGKYLRNCPDPEVFLQMNRFIIPINT